MTHYIGPLAQLLTPVGDWATRAACSVDTADAFYPDGGQRQVAAANEAARDLCGSCPVATECRQWAVDNREQWGTWGGQTAEEREAADPRPRRRHTGGGRQLAPCGTPAAYERHVARGEDIDQACWNNRSRRKQKQEAA